MLEFQSVIDRIRATDPTLGPARPCGSDETRICELKDPMARQVLRRYHETLGELRKLFDGEDGWEEWLEVRKPHHRLQEETRSAVDRLRFERDTLNVLLWLALRVEARERLPHCPLRIGVRVNWEIVLLERNPTEYEDFIKRAHDLLMFGEGFLDMEYGDLSPKALESIA